MRTARVLRTKPDDGTVWEGVIARAAKCNDIAVGNFRTMAREKVDEVSDTILFSLDDFNSRTIKRNWFLPPHLIILSMLGDIRKTDIMLGGSRIDDPPTR